MLGLDHLIPVAPIEGHLDEKGAYVIADQDIEPWKQAVDEIMSNKSAYESLSMKVHDTTSQWLKNIDEKALENWLLNLTRKSASQ